MTIETCDREQALAAGGLIDVGTPSGWPAVRVGVTQEVWADCVTWTDADNEQTGADDTASGRLANLLSLALAALGRRGDAGRVDFKVYRVPRRGHNADARPVELTLVLGVDADARPVATIRHRA